MRTKARDGFIKALRDAHRWLDELLVDPTQTIESLAIRESKSERSGRGRRHLCCISRPQGPASRLHRTSDTPPRPKLPASLFVFVMGAGSGSSRTPLIHPAPFRAPQILLVVIGRRSASASASPSRGPGNGILRAETGGRIQAQNAGERWEFGSQTATCLANRPKLRGFLPTRKPRRFAGTAWWSQTESNRRPLQCHRRAPGFWAGCRNRTDGHRSLASLQNEAACRGFSARNDLSQRMSKSLAGKPKALTMNRYLPVSLRFHSLSSRSTAMVVTCSRALRRLQE